MEDGGRKTWGGRKVREKTERGREGGRKEREREGRRFEREPVLHRHVLNI